MKRINILKDGEVVNWIFSDEETAQRLHPDAWEVASNQSENKQFETFKSCTPSQGLIALFALKEISEQDILTAIESIDDPVQRYTAKIGYQRATVWERTSPTMQLLAQLFGLSDADLDELFAYAVGVYV